MLFNGHSLAAIERHPALPRDQFFTVEGYAHHCQSINRKRREFDGELKVRRPNAENGKGSHNTKVLDSEWGKE